MPSPQGYFQECIDALRSILDSDLTSFRAGGYCSQPFELVAPVLADNGIYIDSSVVPRMKLSTIPFDFDYSDVSYTSPYILDCPSQADDDNGGLQFKEYPVTTHTITGIQRVASKLVRKISGNKKYGDGVGLQMNGNAVWFDKFRTINKIATFDDTSYSAIKACAMSQTYMCSVSHPKNFSKVSIRNLARYLDDFGEYLSKFE